MKKLKISALKFDIFLIAIFAKSVEVSVLF